MRTHALTIAAVFFTVIIAARAYGQVADWGYECGRGKVDFNGDGYKDYCRVIGTNQRQLVACKLSTGGTVEGLYAGDDILSSPLDWGYCPGRAWVDFNGDRKADYCRIIGTSENGYFAQCTLSNGNSFGDTITSGRLDAGYEDARDWRDVNGDGKVDFCRVVGDHREFLQCTLSTGNGFGRTIQDTRE